MKDSKDRRTSCSMEKKLSIKASIAATAAKRKSQVLKVYECKIVEKRLNARQREQLKMLFVEGKWFYNHVLSLHRKGIELQKINTTAIKAVDHFDKDKNRITSELMYLNAQEKQGIVSRMASNEKTIATLIRKGLQSHGGLNFISELNSIPLKQYGVTYRFKTFNKVKIGGISGNVLVRTGGQLQDVDELANANLVQKADGYYLMVTTFIGKEKIKKEEKNGKEIGLDFGIKTSMTTSEGEKLDVSVGEGDRLKRLQKEMSRRAKGSNNRRKTIGLIRREYLKLSNRKRDMANKIVSKLKKYETVVIQDEQIAGWHRGLFGRRVQHSCLGLVKARLKALPQTIVLDRWIPTTKWCPECGTVNRYLTLADRTYRCGCGRELDRDVHAARNMLKIKDLVFRKLNLVPTEHREVTLTEFRAATGDSFSGKSGR